MPPRRQNVMQLHAPVYAVNQPLPWFSFPEVDVSVCRERAVVASRLVRFTWRRRSTHASALSSGNVHIVTHSSTVLISYFDVSVTTYIYLPASTATRCILTGYALCVNVDTFLSFLFFFLLSRYWHGDETLFFRHAEYTFEAKIKFVFKSSRVMP